VTDRISLSIHSPPRPYAIGRESKLQKYVFFPYFFQRYNNLPRASEPLSTTIQDLDNDSLLNVFHLFRPSLIEVDESGTAIWKWGTQQWWYKLAQVCSRWRWLILGSASYLGLSLVCKPGISIADMLAHSPPLPLIIGFNHPAHELTAEDEKGILYTLQQRDRVQCIYLQLPVLSLQKLIINIDGEFPALQYLFIGPPTEHDAQLALPPTFEAPHLRRLSLSYFASQIGSSLLSTSTGLVRLLLDWIHPSTYPHPNDFLQQLASLPQLENLEISFRSPVPNRDIGRQLLDDPITIHVTHINLRVFDFVGVSDFLEAVLPHLATPLLETFRVQFFNQLRFPVPHLPQFMLTAEKLRFGRAVLIFHHEAVLLRAFTHVGARFDNLNVTVSCRHLDWQVSSAKEICNFLRPLLSGVVDLTLDHREHTLSSAWHNQADPTQWRDLLESFGDVKTLRVHNGLVGELSRSLLLDGEPPLQVLPKLKELVCPINGVDDQTYAPFIREREVAGQPVDLIGEAIPVGPFDYYFYSPVGTTHITSDSVTLL
jgi:hypothetical protein